MANTIGIFEVERLPCLRRTVFGYDPDMTLRSISVKLN